VRKLWTWGEFDAPATRLWELLVDPEQWPRWGPSVRSAAVDGDTLAEGVRGTVTTALGIDLPFEITKFDAGTRWAWTVGGIPATDHRVEALGPERCRVGFGVPWVASPYLAVCRLALWRLGGLLHEGSTATD
jgi:hypothetical protein